MLKKISFGAAVVLTAATGVLFSYSYAGAETNDRNQGSAEANGEKPWDAVNFSVAFDIPPEAVKAVRPEYPKEEYEADVEGDVILIVYIDESGDVRNAVVQQSPGSAALEEAAKAAAYKCKFKPAMKDGEPVGTWFAIVMQFRL